MFFSDDLLDAQLAELAQGDRVHLCSAEPASFAAIADLSLGATDMSWTAPADRTGGGRQATGTPAAGAAYAASGTAAFYAVVDTVNSRLLIANALSASQAVTAGQAIDLADLVFYAADFVSA